MTTYEVSGGQVSPLGDVLDQFGNICMVHNSAHLQKHISLTYKTLSETGNASWL